MAKTMEELMEQFYHDPNNMKKKHLIQLANHFQLFGYKKVSEISDKPITLSPRLIEKILKEEYLKEEYNHFDTNYNQTLARFRRILLEEAEKATAERHYADFEGLVSEAIANEAIELAFDRMKHENPVFAKKLEAKMDELVRRDL